MRVIDFFCETLNKRVEVLWHQTQYGEFANVDIAGYAFRLMIETNYLDDIKQHPLVTNHRIGFISFGELNGEQQYQQSLTNNKHLQSLEIFATVTNAFKDKYSEYDAMFFAAKHPKRSSLYGRIAIRVAADLHPKVFQTIETKDGGQVIVLAKYDIDPLLQWLRDNYTF